jgi:hypothetical protein
MLDKGAAIGANPIGSNKKFRTSLIYTSPIDLRIFKGLSSDFAEVRGQSASKTVIDVLVESAAHTHRGRAYASYFYCRGNPNCLWLYERFFSELSALGECEGDATSVLQSFYQYSLDHSVTMDLGNDLIHHLADQWGAITRALSECGPEDDIDAKTLADRAVDLGTVLRSPDGFPNERVVGYIELIRDGWRCLRNHSATYRALRDLAFLGKSTNKAVRDTGSERLELIRTMDTFFRACEQSSNQTGRSPVMTRTGTGGIADML